VNPEVAEHWRNYDIRLVLEEKWWKLGPKLQDKIHVFGGAWDSFYLNHALELLEEFLESKDHGGYVEILPGSHGSFLTEEVEERIYREMAERSARP
jgi:hypothetical protein